MENRRRKKRISAAYRYSFSRLVLQLWMYYEDVLEYALERSKEEAEDGEELARILGKFLDSKGESDTGEAFSQLKGLREKLIGKMEILTGFSDCFQIYEYVLNRVERRFVVLEDSDYTPKELAADLVQAMAAMEDSAGRNGWLRDIVAQLPVRFTRQKFYSMVMERLSAYTGLNKGNVEDYFYMVKSSVMVRLPEGMDKEERLYELLSLLEQADYRHLDQDGFHRCADSLGEGSRLLSARTDFYLSLEQMVNDLYVLFLTEKEKLIDAQEEQLFRNGAKRILEAVESRDESLVGEDGILTQMEGIQESVADLVMAGSPEKDEILDKVDRLVSGSFFMPVEPKEACREEADRQWIDEEAKKFCQELDGLFAGRQKAVVRAVMARVLSSLPVMFGDSREVEEYIRTSLESCTDSAEREASMELLEQELMDQRLNGNVLV